MSKLHSLYHICQLQQLYFRIWHTIHTATENISEIPMWYLNKLYFRIFGFSPVYPTVNMFQILDEIHEHANNPVKLRID